MIPVSLEIFFIKTIVQPISLDKVKKVSLICIVIFVKTKWVWCLKAPVWEGYDVPYTFVLVFPIQLYFLWLNYYRILHDIYKVKVLEFMNKKSLVCIFSFSLILSSQFSYTFCAATAVSLIYQI